MAFDGASLRSENEWEHNERLINTEAECKLFTYINIVGGGLGESR